MLHGQAGLRAKMQLPADALLLRTALAGVAATAAGRAAAAGVAAGIAPGVFLAKQPDAHWVFEWASLIDATHCP